MSVVIRYNDFSLICFCFDVYNEQVFPITVSLKYVASIQKLEQGSRKLSEVPVSVFRDQVVR